MGFPPLQNFFSFLSLDINFFANFAVEKNNSHSLKPREIPCGLGIWDQPKRPYKSSSL
jgi:hypothetical protein